MYCMLSAHHVLKCLLVVAPVVADKLFHVLDGVADLEDVTLVHIRVGFWEGQKKY